MGGQDGEGTGSERAAFGRRYKALAHKFDYRVVAEGVETADVLCVLERSGCDEVQGYFFAKPLSSVDFGVWLHLFGQRELKAA